MTLKNISLDYKKALIFTLFLTVIYELILSFQGFDLCDEGAALTVYQQIFKCPGSVEYQFVYYLGGIVGGVWNIFFGFGGILSFRILTVIVLVLTVYFTCQSLKEFIKPIVIPIAASLVLLLNNYGIMVFFHDYLTALLAAITVYFLLRGLNLNRPWYLFIAALFCGINIFTRIPNITLLALGFLLFIDYSYHKNNRLLGRNILFCIAGLLAGIAAVFLLMFLLGHEKIFAQTVFDNLLSKGSSSDSPHQFNKLLAIYWSNYYQIFIYLSIFIFTLAFFSFIYRFYKHKWEKGIVILLYSVIIIAFSLFAFNCEKYYAVILFPVILSCYVDRKNKPLILLNFASLIVLFCMPLGSDVGVLNMGYFSVWLATFTAVAHVYRFIRWEMRKHNSSYRLFFVVFYVMYCIYGLYVVSRNAYNDRGPRWEKLFRAQNDKFTVFTSKEKAKAMDVLLSELGKYVHKGDYLLCYESLPMVHYLTETKPYIGNPWVWVYDANNFIRHLKKSEETIPLPVVVRQKCQPIGGYWTTPAPVIEPSDPVYKSFYSDERTNGFEKFLKDNLYLIAWENELFQIYLPPNKYSNIQ
jgi:hypothetical protein